MRGRAVLPGYGRGGLQAVLQLHKLHVLGARVRAVAALLRVLISWGFGARQSLVFRALRSIGQREHHHRQLVICWLLVPLPGDYPPRQ